MKTITKTKMPWERDRLTPEDYLKKLTEKGLNPDGSLVPDSTPIAPPIGYIKQPSLSELIRDMVRGEKLRQEAIEAGHETFEESEDFDIGEDHELNSGYENDLDVPVGVALKELEIHENAQKAKQTKKPGAGQRPAKAPEPPDSGGDLDEPLPE